MLTLTMIPIFCVAAGGAIGALLRYAAVQCVQHFYATAFPFGTMLVNVIGSLVLGVMMARYVAHPSESAQLFFITGVLGGFTTFSAFSWEALQLLQRGQLAAAGMYIGGSVIFSLVAVAAGFQLGR
jgi:fluoride exporter